MPPDTLAALGYLGHKDSCLSTFPELFSLLEEIQGTLPRSCLEIFCNLAADGAAPPPHLPVNARAAQLGPLGDALHDTIL